MSSTRIPGRGSITAAATTLGRAWIMVTPFITPEHNGQKATEKKLEV
jgi:hypothetical protein